MPYYEIVAEATRAVVVEADDLDHAYELASEECTSHEWDIHTFSVSVDGEDLSLKDVDDCLRFGAIRLEEW